MNLFGNLSVTDDCGGTWTRTRNNVWERQGGPALISSISIIAVPIRTTPSQYEIGEINPARERVDITPMRGPIETKHDTPESPPAAPAEDDPANP